MGLVLATAVFLHFFGTATDSRGHFLFREEYFVEKQEGTVASVTVDFYDVDQNKLGHLVSTFEKGNYVPNIEFCGPHLSYSIQKGEEGVEVLYAGEKRTLEFKKTMTGGSGFYLFILDHLSLLLKGGKKTIHLILPDKLTDYAFVVTAVRQGEYVLAELTLKNLLLRPFAPKTRVLIDPKTEAILRYEGLDAFLGIAGSQEMITITYTTPEAR